jgi:hypothetical protein
VSLREVLDLTPQRPVFGNQRPNGTHWLVFLKDAEVE